MLSECWERVFGEDFIAAGLSALGFHAIIHPFRRVPTTAAEGADTLKSLRQKDWIIRKTGKL